MIQRNVLDWLETSADRFPGKTVFDTEHEKITFGTLLDRSKEIGTYILNETGSRKPVLIIMDKGINSILSIMGTIYAGCFYTPLDESMPDERIRLIIGILSPALILTEPKYRDKVQGLSTGIHVCDITDIPATVDECALSRVRENGIDTDLLYVLFTSGSTGVPKGVAVSHRSVIDLTEWAVEKLQITDKTRFANQAPLYFDNSVLEIYSTLKAGASLHFISKRALVCPAMLPYYLNKYHINTLFWVPTVYTMVAKTGALAEDPPHEITHCFFCGEVMPVSTLNAWKAVLPDAVYVNMYGPTEITDVCTYYIVDRDFNENEMLPIGRACENTRIVLLDGEICVQGSCLAAGYYHDPEKTTTAFVQIPNSVGEPERTYRTGDYAAYNERGELMFLGRKDNQIKKNGNRIELGEIENAASSMSQINGVCCLYELETEKIVCFCSGPVDAKELRRHFGTKLQRYMIPDVIRVMESLPTTGSGKIDRSSIRKLWENEKKEGALI